MGAQRARIPLPFGKSIEENKTRMRCIIGQTVVASKLRDASVRYYTTAGPGNFSLTPEGCKSAFYVVVYTGSLSPDAPAGLHEYTVDVPLKPQLLATTKSNNYMLNALTSMASKDKGGMMGVLVDSKGFIAESAVMNIIFLMKGNRLVTPPFKNILAGTTCKKILQLAEQLVAEKMITAVAQEPIKAEQAHEEALEMLMCGGDHHIFPVIRWDDRDVGNGKIGDVTKRIIAMVNKEIEEGSSDHYELNYMD